MIIMNFAYHDGANTSKPSKQKKPKDSTIQSEKYGQKRTIKP